MSEQTEHIKKRMLLALEKSRGIVTSAAESAGISRTTHYEWLQSDPAYKAAVEDIGELAIDFVESKLMQKIEGVLVQRDTMDGPVIYELPPSDTAAIFYLKCKAKKRGYVEKTEIDITGTPIHITISDKI